MIDIMVTPTKQTPRKRPRDGAAASFHSRIEQLRRERTWTQAELARRLGVQRSLVANYEHGVSLPPLPMLEKLAKVFDVSLDHLVFSDPPLKEAVKDRELLTLFAAAQELNFEDKSALKHVIQGLIAKTKSDQAR